MPVYQKEINKVYCITPPLTYPRIASGTKTVYISYGSNLVTSGSAVIYGEGLQGDVLYNKTLSRTALTPIISSMTPDVITTPSGIIKVFGSNFINNQNTSCFLNNELSLRTRYIFHNELWCYFTLNDYLFEHASLKIMNGGLNLYSNSVPLAFAFDSILSSISPSFGPLEGGTIVVVKGIFACESQNLKHAFCSFGNERAIAKYCRKHVSIKSKIKTIPDQK